MRYLTMNSVGQMEDHYMPMRYRTAGGGDDANSHGHAHAMSSTMAGIKRTAEEAGISSHQQHHHQQQQQYMCDSNGMKQNAMSMANSSQSVMSNSPVPGATGVSQVQDPQPSTSHPTDQKPGLPNGKKTKGRVKIKMEFIDNKLRRYTTFSKRKTGIMKKAYELSTLTGTQVMLLVASETGHVYTFATRKLQPMITSDTGKDLIQMCLNSPDPPADPRCQVNDPRGQPSGFEETDLSYSVDDEKEQQRLAYHAASAMEEDMAGDDDEGSPIAVDDNGDDEESGGEEEYGSPASFHEGSSTHSDVKPFIRKMHMQQPKRFNGNYRRNYHVDDEEAVLGKRTVEVKKAPPGLLPIAGKSAANAAEQKRGRGNSEQKAVRGDVSGVPENFCNGPGASYLIQTPQGFIFNNGNLGRDHFLHTDLTGTAASIASTLPEGTCIMRKDRMSEGMSKRK